MFFFPHIIRPKPKKCKIPNKEVNTTEPIREHWTAEAVGKMHEYGISQGVLASAMGIHPDYLSRILAGRVAPKGINEKVLSAIAAIIEEAPQ